ncbi:hypothetical protein CC80DRAFT_596298 [Byssothecium circinans]|uniref:F-box domain-containing protein n=1 Tax=Byssothecium circinans TaxID=147558 RepID=A0A6A5TMC9_9PLEO|nr:hypothetical protein CC80DRAFT_596298 [Byssothecium circinans]
MLNEKDFPPLPSQAAKRTRIKQRLPAAVPARNDGIAASINDLPDELWLEILDYLPALDLEDFQLQTLSNLSRVNRRIHSLVSERLYAGFNSFFCASYPFLRTIISNQQLAGSVQSMRIAYGHGVHAERSKYKPSVLDKRIVKNGLKGKDIPGWKSWAVDCNNDEAEQEILYATILMHTPNITKLTVDDGEVPYVIPKWLDLVRRIGSGSRFGHVHKFLHLKSLQIETSSLKIRQLSPIFKLPALKNVTLIGLIELARTEEEQSGVLQRLLPIRTSAVEELSLKEALIQDDILEVLLRSFRVLRRFELTYSHDRYTDVDSGPFSSPLNSLKIHRLELQVLHLSNNFFGSISSISPGMVKCLHQFEELYDLQVPLDTLVDTGRPHSTISVDSLPPALTSLTIFVKAGRQLLFLDALKHLASQSRECIPLLRELRIELFSVYENSSKYDWEGFRQIWAKTGVHLEIRFESDEYDERDGVGILGLRADTDTESESESDEESLYSN